MATERPAVADAVARLIDEVERWDGVTVGDHRPGGTEFRLGPHEIGHVNRW